MKIICNAYLLKLNIIGWVERIAAKAMESQPDSSSTTDRALRCRHKLTGRLRLLNEHPCAYGSLTVRSLLDTIEHCLREFDFPDPYLSQKRLENNYALSTVSFLDLVFK